MILTLAQPFMGFIPTEMTSDGKCAWREEYKATNTEGKSVRLIVYALDRLPKGIEADDIMEVKLYQQEQCKAAYKMLSNGKREKRQVAWMALEADDEAVRLSDWIANNGAMDASEAAEVTKSLLESVMMIGRFTNDGGIYNLCPENIELSIDRSSGQAKIKAVHLTNLFCAGMPFSGNAPFSISMLNYLYTAPEARYGKFCHASDIYVMGLILAYMTVGHYPWDTDGVNTLSQLNLRRMKCRRMPANEGIQSIINCALSNSFYLRYKNADEMIRALRVFLGEIEETEEDKAKNERRRKEIQLESASKSKSDEENTNDYQQRCFVEFEQLRGNGFADVAGMDEIKRQFRRDFIDIVQNTDLAKQFEIQPPSMTLLAGVPGCGKTFIVRKLAEECNLQFCYIHPSQLGNTLVHGSQQMIADLFAKAEKKAKETKSGVLIMLDEFDALAPTRRGNDNSCRNDEVNELLTQINECSLRGIHVLAATNRPDILDGAITRSGRCDAYFFVGLPDHQTRKEILELELKRRPHENNLDVDWLASLTDGFTSSDICAIVKEAGREAFDRSIHTVDKSVVKINQQLLEDTINCSRPSVSIEELREFEYARDKFLNKKDKCRPSIGFHTYK